MQQKILCKQKSCRSCKIATLFQPRSVIHETLGSQDSGWGHNVIFRLHSQLALEPYATSQFLVCRAGAPPESVNSPAAEAQRYSVPPLKPNAASAAGQKKF